MISAELIIFEDVLSCKHLITPILKLMGSVFQTVDVMPTGPDLKVSHLGTQAGLVLHDELATFFLGSL